MAYTTIDDPSVYFQTLLYTGNSSTRSVTNDGNADLQPDWVWTKCRSNASDNFVFDSNRGVHKRLFTNTSAAEVSNTNALTAFNSDGFSMGNVGGMNFNSQTYVAWQWKANGGTTASNSDGSITSTVQANTTAGFSVVTWTSNGSGGQTIGHGLGVAPNMVILKNSSATEAWQVYHQGIGEGKHLMLDRTNAEAANTNIWSNTSPTSTLFYVGANSFSSNNDEIVMYCFAEKKGFSKFGSFTGNNSTDGPFVYTGFKPAWLLVKNTTDSGDDWHMYDATRDTFNVADARLKANDTGAEATDAGFDFLSNGFKVRSTSNARNGNGDTIIYMCFASSPFVGSDGTPCTAR